MRAARGFLIFLILLIISPFSMAEIANESGERILEFNEDIFINTDASLNVTETIQVLALQDRIRHGIYRRLRNYFYDLNDQFHMLSYDVQQVTMNSAAEPYHFSHQRNELYIYIGSADKLLSPGTYEYTLQYRVMNAVSFLQNEDALYWNVTGNYWEFPIERVSVNVYLPAKIKPTRITAYTGKAKEQGQDYQVYSSYENEFSFVTTRTLEPGEGLTLDVAWPKGVIRQPTWRDRLSYFYLRNKAEFLAFLLLGVVLIYYIVIWLIEVQEPPRGTIIPLFEPPAGLSPAALRYISEMDCDDRTLATALIELAIGGYLTIQQSSNQGFSLQRNSNVDLDKVPEPERMFLEQLFINENSLVLDGSGTSQLKAAKRVLKKNLRAEFESVYFDTYSVYLIPGFFLSLIAVALLLMQVDLDHLQFWVMATYLYTGILYVSYIRAESALKDYRDLFETRDLLRIVGYGLSFVAMVITIIWVVLADPEEAVSFGTCILIGTLFFNLLFYHLLKAHTPKGRLLMDQIEGFKMYLAAAELPRLEQFTPPDKTPELFEKYLPYAVAMNLETSWGKQFAEVLQKADTAGYQPRWYYGDNWSTMQSSVFFDTMLYGFYNSVTNCMTPKSEHGGASAGGGGGGGGGGGW